MHDFDVFTFVMRIYIAICRHVLLLESDGRIVYSSIAVTVRLSNRRWPATVTRGREKLGRPWGSFVVLFCYNACLISFSYCALHCTASNVSEFVLNHARFRPWGGARVEVVSSRCGSSVVW